MFFIKLICFLILRNAQSKLGSYDKNRICRVQSFDVILLCWRKHCKTVASILIQLHSVEAYIIK